MRALCAYSRPPRSLSCPCAFFFALAAATTYPAAELDLRAAWVNVSTGRSAPGDASTKAAQVASPRSAPASGNVEEGALDAPTESGHTVESLLLENQRLQQLCREQREQIERLRTELTRIKQQQATVLTTSTSSAATDATGSASGTGSAMGVMNLAAPIAGVARRVTDRLGNHRRNRSVDTSSPTPTPPQP